VIDEAGEARDMTSESALEARVAALEAEAARLRAKVEVIEDQREIASLIARYGTTADTDDDDGFVDLYTDDGAITTWSDRAERAASWEGKDQVRAFITDPEGHRRPELHGKSMHLHGNNLEIDVQADRAAATSYGVTLVKGDDGVRVLSAAGNHWDLRRVDGAWRIKERRNASLGDGRFAANLESSRSRSDLEEGRDGGR
jgi:hypothetical protein